MSARRRVRVVAGGQYGSEAKGHITHRLVKAERERGRDVINLRVAGPNAGHTVYGENGYSGTPNKFALRQVPVGAVEPEVSVGIAAGSEVDPAVLLDEIDSLDEAGYAVSRRLLVDPEATVIERRHHLAEESGLAGGSTRKGIGAARSDRLMRVAKRVIDDLNLVTMLRERGVQVRSVAPNLANNNATIVVEGTQGYGLGLHAGAYPHTTSSDCRAIDFLAMVGLNPFGPAWDYQVHLVARTFPIRIAGASGPLAGETTWDALGLPPEYTTVTKKMRRVGRWDPSLMRRAVQANGGGDVVKVAITMLDQKYPDLAKVSERSILRDHERATAWLTEVEQAVGAEIVQVTTGPQSGVWL